MSFKKKFLLPCALKKCTVACLAALLVSGFVAVHAAPVTIFQDCSFGGYSVDLPAGSYTTADLVAKGARDNDISSVMVTAGYQVTLYSNDNFSGTSFALVSSNSCLIANGFNDQTSSIQVVQTVTGAWTGTWAVSPQSSSSTFNRQTLRQIVHTSIAGTSARMQLSNVFGAQPLTVSDVHIAQSSSGATSTIVAATDKIVTFGGQTSITIAAGALAVSDQIAFAVSALSDVAISFYLPVATSAVTSHQQGTQTNYILSGDGSANATLAGASTTGSYYILTNLDVQNSSALGAVVTLGASITDGVASSQNSNRRWPNDLAVRIVNSGRIIGVLNQGISGNDLLTDGAGQSALNRFSRDVLSQPNVKWVIFSDDPVNDLGSANRPTSDQLIAGVTQLITRAHQSGIKFFCSTLTPFQGAGYWTSQGETEREAINAFIRGGTSGCDGIIDQDSATHDPANPTMYLPAYDAGDHLHPNEAGLQAIANAVNLALFSTTSIPVISFRARANSRYVTADNAGSSPLIANSTTIGTSQQFDELDQGSGNIALRAHVNSRYVTAENAGAASLIANRTAIGLWETFQLIHNSDGTVTLRALVNNMYVTAENAGASPLIANRTAIGTWEKFDMITQ
jgi:lysophospholipase L1-like esterase